MTWSAKATVDSASRYNDFEFDAETGESKRDSEPKIHVNASAKAEDITSNTEGGISNVSVTFTFTIVGDKSRVAVGDVINLSGHFGFYPKD